MALVVRTLLDHNPKRDQWLVIARSSNDTQIEQALANGVFDSLIIDPLTRVVVTHAINISLDLEDILTGFCGAMASNAL